MRLVASFDLEIDQMYVKTIFLHRDLEEETYMKQHEGFTIKGKEVVCRLKKSFYVLKQSPRMWYHKFDSYIQGFEFKKSQVDYYLYIRPVEYHLIYVTLYVDDMLLVGNNMDLIKEVKRQLFSKFNMKDLGLAHFILGMEIKSDIAKKRL